MSNHLYDALMEGRRDSTAVFIETVEKKPRRFTFADMHKMAGRFARALSRLGARPGDRITVQVDKSPEAFALYLACLRGGFVFQPLNSAYTPAEVAWFIADASPAVVVCDPDRKADLAGAADRAGARLVTLRGDWRGSLFMLQMTQPDSFRTVPRAPGDAAAMLYTSGTTGRSKGAVLTHENLLSNARDLKDIWRFTPDDRLIHALPIYHVHGLFVACHTALLASARLLWLERFKAKKIVKTMPQATVLMGVPTFYARLLGQRGLKRAASGMRLFISGSAPLSPALHAAFLAATGQAIVERYGLTETGMLTSNPLDGPRKPGSAGLPLPSVTLRITGARSGVPVEPGEPGMIEAKGPNVFPGYWQQPEKTAEAFRDGWFITGDLGFFDSGGYLHISGRARDLVITGGLNVYPAEVEAAIDAIEGVAESAIIGLPDAEWGEIVCAVIAPEKGARLDEDAILCALEGTLARFKQPKRIIFTDALPRNAMGKVQKNILRQRYAKA